MILKLCKEKTVQMRYKNGTLGVQFFLGYKLFKWGTVPQNEARLATLDRRYPVEILIWTGVDDHAESEYFSFIL